MLRVDLMSRRIVIAVEQGEHSDYAVRWATRELLKKDDEIVLLHAYSVDVGFFS